MRKADAELSDFSVSRDAPFAPELVVIPAGEFMMGSAEAEQARFDNERLQHRVTIGQRFAIGRYSVTFGEYDRFCRAKQRKKPQDEG
jgi:formylglycine-generating enzyme required for sulfatase activity